MTSEPYEYIDPLTGQRIVVHPSETTNYVADGERRREPGMSETAKQPITEADINTAIEKLCADHERELAAKDAEIERLKKELEEPWKHSDHWRDPETGQVECECCCAWALDCSSLQDENAPLKAQVERLSAPVIISDDELLGLNEKYGYFQFGDAQGDKSRAFADDISRIIASRAEKEKE